MRDNTIVLIVAELGLLVLAVAGLALGNEDLSLVAAGAFVGVLGGHLNGLQDGD